MVNSKLYDEIIDELKGQLDNSLFEKIKSKRLHLAIFSPVYLRYVLDGKKVIESRFSKNKIAPYDKISKDDVVVIKESSKDVVALFTIKEVLQFNTKKISVNTIKEKYNDKILADDNFWNAKEKTSNYATLIVIDKVIKLKPFKINKVGMQSWVILNYV